MFAFEKVRKLVKLVLLNMYLYDLILGTIVMKMVPGPRAMQRTTT